MRVFEACCRYNPGYRQGLIDTPLVVIAGKDFGKGANREWAAKGEWMSLCLCQLVYWFGFVVRNQVT